MNEQYISHLQGCIHYVYHRRGLGIGVSGRSENIFSIKKGSGGRGLENTSEGRKEDAIFRYKLHEKLSQEPAVK